MKIYVLNPALKKDTYRSPQDYVTTAQEKKILKQIKKGYILCACNCGQLYSPSLMVSSWDNQFNKYVLTYYKHRGLSKEAFREIGY